ncbi:hypothetical protein [Bosea sp. BIWAKO-01]|uniref:hypothetical protein n=1 Tax=Bosea sp. BIWAKO-01 TaxID=506668 RepID=UPI00086E5B48|nr:hypothetical protein BIWAKO_04656 [Bosea sp. BIWAKO-01]
MALERYYLAAGDSDPVIIDIPKGAYVPHFRRQPPLSVSAKASEIALVSGNVIPPAWPQRRRFLIAAIVAAMVGSLLVSRPERWFGPASFDLLSPSILVA